MITHFFKARAFVAALICFCTIAATHAQRAQVGGNRQGANRKVAELRKLGVEEFFVVQDDPDFRFAISLGVFKSRDAARSRLAELRAKGVRTARIGERETQVQKVFFTVREVSEPVAARLNELRQTFPGSELRECAPASRRPAPA